MMAGILMLGVRGSSLGYTIPLAPRISKRPIPRRSPPRNVSRGRKVMLMWMLHSSQRDVLLMTLFGVMTPREPRHLSITVQNRDLSENLAVAGRSVSCCRYRARCTYRADEI